MYYLQKYLYTSIYVRKYGRQQQQQEICTGFNQSMPQIWRITQRPPDEDINLRSNTKQEHLAECAM